MLENILEYIGQKEEECEKLEAIVTEAEEAPICFHCSEEPCIRQERDKYKQALDEIEYIADDYNRIEKTSQYYRDGFDGIQDIINKVKDSE